jgi:rhamnosyltransferase
MNPHVSVIIPTRNGMPLLERCLSGVLSQQTPWQFEVIVIDSGSSDGTWELLETLPLERVRIDPRDFNHGVTRNFGATMARGEFLAFLVQDAIPVDEFWLVNLVTACELSGVAGAYSRQCPRPESTPLTRYLTIGTTPNQDTRVRKQLPPHGSMSTLPPEEQFALAVFQNNSSCMRRSVWLEHPFMRIPYGEDIEWGRRVIESGHAIVYEPKSVVYHSHDRSALYALKRAYADHYQVMELFGWVMVPSLSRMLKSTLWNTFQAWRFIAASSGSPGSKARFSVLTPLFTAAIAVGQYVGPRGYARAMTPSWWWRADQLLRRGV